MSEEKKESLLDSLCKFLERDMWHISLDESSWASRLSVKVLRVITLVSDGFKRNQCSLRASSLTLFSLLSLVPVLVMVLAMARAFGGAELARQKIDEKINAFVESIEQGANQTTDVETTSAENQASAPEAATLFATQVRNGADKIFEQVNSIDFAKLGGAGAILLLWSVISVLGKVEASFNQIWAVDKPRPLLRKFTEYLAVIVILPFLITAVSTVPVFQTVSSVMESTMGARASSGIVAMLNSDLLRIVMSAIGGTLTFAFLLGFMPNERVKLVPVLAAGFITMVLFTLWMKVCTMLQVGLARYSALYGGFAVLPILLVWVHMSWQIILLGAEISFAIQNRDSYMLEQFADQASARARLLMAVTLCVESVRATKGENGGAFDAKRYARVNGVPYRFVDDILDELVELGFLAEVSDQTGKYLLCKCGSTLTATEIVEAMMDKGETIATLGLEELSSAVAELSRKWRTAEKQALSLSLNQLCVEISSEKV